MKAMNTNSITKFYSPCKAVVFCCAELKTCKRNKKCTDTRVNNKNSYSKTTYMQELLLCNCRKEPRLGVMNVVALWENNFLCLGVSACNGGRKLHGA